jgi:hypothetical protein
MMFLSRKVITSIILLLSLGLGIIAYFAINTNIPKEAPVPIVKYNDLIIPTVPSMYNWIDEKKGGNSHLNPLPEEATKDMTAIAVEPNSPITIKFDTKYQPKQMEIIHWTQREIGSKVILNDERFSTPAVSGIYVYEIIGRWDDTHDSAHSFRIKVK